VIKKITRWSGIKLNLLIFGPLLVIGLLIVLWGGNHDDHEHPHAEPPVNQKTAEKKATNIIAQLINNKQLDESWVPITASSVKKVVFKGYQEWEVIFVNNKVADTTKRKIYVFLTLSGDHVAVNYSGK